MSHNYGGFNLGKFASVTDIKPDSRADRFFQQMRQSIDQRQRLRARYNPSLKLTHFNDGIEEFNEWTSEDMELIRQDLVDLNDAKGDIWLAGIIKQRQSMYSIMKRQLEAEADTEVAREREEEKRKREMYEQAMERTKLAEELKEKERVMHIYRVGKANRILREDHAKRLKKEKYYAQIDKGIADMEKKEKKVKK